MDASQGDLQRFHLLSTCPQSPNASEGGGICEESEHINGQTLRGDSGDGDVGWGESSLCGMKGEKRGGRMFPPDKRCKERSAGRTGILILG